MTELGPRRATCVGVLPQGACDVSMTEKTAIVVRTRWPVASVFFAFIFRTFVTIDGVTSLLSPRGNHVLPVRAWNARGTSVPGS